MSAAYELTSSAGLALLGVFALLIGWACIAEHRRDRGNEPLHMMLWDVLIAAFSAGTSLAYVAATLFLVGSAFILIGALGAVWALVNVVQNAFVA